MAGPLLSQVATSVPFDNSTNGFTSTNVQDAIEEIGGPNAFNDKFDFHIASLSAFDKIVAITYLDAGLRTERINTITYSSVTFPNANLVKTLFWLDPGSINQRLDKEEYVGAALSPDSLRKNYSYTLVGNRYRRSGFSLEAF